MPFLDRILLTPSVFGNLENKKYLKESVIKRVSAQIIDELWKIN